MSVQAGLKKQSRNLKRLKIEMNDKKREKALKKTEEKKNVPKAQMMPDMLFGPIFVVASFASPYCQIN
jgi:hypothetical protein